jgi:hypothetical protein
MSTSLVSGSNAAALSQDFSNLLNAKSGSGSGTVDNLVQTFASELSQFLKSSSNGSQFEVDINPAANSSGGPLTITVKNLTQAPANTAAASAVSANSPSADASQTPATIGYPKGSEIFVAEFGSGPTSQPQPAFVRPPVPDFYQLPAVHSVKGVKTLESVMQQQLTLAEYGTSQMIQGNWSLNYLKDSFRVQAQAVAAAQGANPDPNVLPANWSAIADQYTNTYMQWLTQTDASYWDPKLSGPVMNAATGAVQTSKGLVDASGAPIAS